MKTYLKGASDPGSYPGYKGGNGYWEHLVQYAQHPRFEGETRWLAGAWAGITITRHVAWDKSYKLLPFRYSFSVYADYPYRHRRVFMDKSPEERGIVTKDDFIARLLRRDIGAEFSLNRTRYVNVPEAITFDNVALNLTATWNERHYYRQRRKQEVSISVENLDKVMDIGMVIGETLLNALEVFHDLNPTRHIDNVAVQEVAAVALQSDRLFPICRIPGVVSKHPSTAL